MNKNDLGKRCSMCNSEIYVKVYKPLRNAFAPITYADQLMDEWENKTGMTYIQLPKQFCPMCGKRLKEVLECKDCIHEHICGYDLRHGQSVSTDLVCDDFSHKETWVDMPCAVGSILYVTRDHKTYIPAKIYSKNAEGKYLVFISTEQKYDWFEELFSEEQVKQKLLERSEEIESK